MLILQSLLLLLLLLLTSFSIAQDQAFSTSSQSTNQAISKCEPQQSYLLTEIMQIQKTNSLSSSLLKAQPFSQLFVKRSCVESALEQVTAGRVLNEKEQKLGRRKFAANNFIRCDKNNKVHDYQETPCQSVDSIKLTHNSFETVTQCLKDFVSGSQQKSVQNEWVKLYFKMLSKESGLQNYVRSHRNAVGSNQLTPQYIRDFIQFSMNDIKNHLNKSDQLVCRRLGQEILSDAAFAYMAQKKSNHAYTYNTCSLIGTNQNQILRNMLIGFSNLKVLRDRVRDSAFDNDQVRISKAEQLSVELSLVPMAYNMGNGNLNRTINKVLKSKVQFVESNSFIRAVQKAIPFKETKNYLSNIDDRFADVVKDSGEPSCFN